MVGADDDLTRLGMVTQIRVCMPQIPIREEAAPALTVWRRRLHNVFASVRRSLRSPTVGPSGACRQRCRHRRFAGEAIDKRAFWSVAANAYRLDARLQTWRTTGLASGPSLFIPIAGAIGRKVFGSSPL